jgi:hypothetical protein
LDVTSSTRRRPTPDEYFEYYDMYIRLVPDGDIIDILKEQLASTVGFLETIPHEKADFRYAPDKWSTKEVIGHIIDAEWVFTSRALWFARGDRQPLPGMEQDEFMAGANYGEWELSSLIEEYRHLRSAGILLFDSFNEEVLDRTGTASDYDFTVRSFPYIIAGHERHHVQVLKERYL